MWTDYWINFINKSCINLYQIFVTYNHLNSWDKSFTFKEDNAVTKLVPNSGKSSLTNTELTQLVPIMEIQTFNSKELMSTTMKPQEEDTSQELYLWILNPELWTQLELDLLDNSSDQTISFLGKLELETTGLKVITLKVLSWSIQYWMLLENKLKDVIVYKDSKSPTHWEVEQDQVWELSSSPKLDNNILIESWKPSPLSHHQKYQTLSLNLIMLPSQSINWLKMLMSVWSLITRHFMISASELSSLLPQPMVILTIWFQLPCLELHAALDSQVNSTLIWEN